MTKQERQIPNLISSQAYLIGLFNARLKEIDQRGVKVLRLNCHFVKSHYDDNFFHFVIQNDLTYKIETGVRRRCKIFCVSFSGHARRKMYQALKLAYEHGFNQGDVIVPKPLWYSDELMAAFYIGVPGENLLEHIKNGYFDPSIIQKVALGLLKLHDIKPTEDIKLKKHTFSPVFLDPTNVINRAYNKDTSLTHEILVQFHRLKKLYQKIIKDQAVFSHGDFHPENVIINTFNNRQLAIIDFSEVTLAPVYYDIASFLQQLEFMTRNYLTPEEYLNTEYVFLSAYFNCKKIPREIQNKINLYKSWTALKSAVYFMIFNDQANRNFAEGLLAESEDLYRQIKPQLKR